MFNMAILTFREIINKKIFVAVIILSVICYTIYGIALHYMSAGANGRSDLLMRPILLAQFFSMGLFFSTFAVSLMAVFMPVAAISGDIESGIMQAIVPQPIRRYEIVLGKYIGYSVMVAIYTTAVYFLVVIMNKFIAGFTPESLWPGLFYFNLLGQVLVAVTLLGSAFMSTMANGVSVILLFLISLVGGMIEQISNMASHLGNVNLNILSNIGIITSLILPTDAMYRKTVAAVLVDPQMPINTMIGNPFGAVEPASTAMIVYTIIYIAVMLFLAVQIFDKRDI